MTRASISVLTLAAIIVASAGRAFACGTDNQACGVGAPCCAGNTCQNFVCKINPGDGWCIFDSDCVSGYVCAWNYCELPTPSTTVCSGNSICSSGNCIGTPNKYCTCDDALSGTCSRDSDCCSGNQCYGGYPDGVCKITTGDGWCIKANNGNDCVSGNCNLGTNHCVAGTGTGNNCLGQADCLDGNIYYTECLRVISGSPPALQGKCLGGVGYPCPGGGSVCVTGQCLPLGSSDECYWGSVGNTCMRNYDCGSNNCNTGTETCICTSLTGASSQCLTNSDCCSPHTCHGASRWAPGTCS
jgi:hypothetical protein